MNIPALCIDVSKSSSFATGFLTYNKPYSKPFTFSHTSEGIKSALQCLKELQDESNSKPDVVMEATGNYYKPVTQYFIDLGYSVYVLNPLRTSVEKRKSIRKIKTDPVDTYRIAQVYYTNDLQPYKEQLSDIQELRSLCRQWDGFNALYTETQLRFRSVLTLIFPKYDTVFTHLCKPTSLRVIASFPSPEAVLTAKPEDLFNLIKLYKHSDEWCSHKVDMLIAAARESLSYDGAQQSNIRVLQSYVKSLLTHKEIMDDIRAQINEWTRLSSDFQLLMSIPGIGEITAATILGEIGDISNFDTAKQLVAYAGLDPSVYQSGSFKAKNTKISKRGTPYLRKALYQAASAAVRRRPNGPCNPVLYKYYTSKINAGKPPKVAMVATCNKLLRIIFGILSSKTEFRTE